MLRPARALAVQGDVPRPPSSAIQISMRIPAEWLAEAAQLATALQRPGFTCTRSDVLRNAIARGLEAIRADVEAAARPTTTKKPKK